MLKQQRQNQEQSFFNEVIQNNIMGEPLAFVDPKKDPKHYIARYLNEPNYKAWFDRNYPNYTIYQGIGISEEQFHNIVNQLTEIDIPEKDTSKEGLTKLKELAEQLKDTESEKSTPDSSKPLTQDMVDDSVKSKTEETPPTEPRGEDIAKSVFNSQSDESAGYDRRTFEEFVDERVLISRDLFGKKEMKIKILEVSDEHQESKIRWKFGDRVKVNKIIITIKHLDTMEVEEGEFDIEAIEKELAEKRHYSSTNRWIPATDIKNGYVVSSKHTALISDAVALDYIIF